MCTLLQYTIILPNIDVNHTIDLPMEIPHCSRTFYVQYVLLEVFKNVLDNIEVKHAIHTILF